MAVIVLLASINAGLTLSGTPGIVTLSSAYSFTFRAVGGTGPYKLVESGSLPTGLTFTDNGDGTATIAGTTAVPGSFPITVTLADATRIAIPYVFILVVQALPLTISGHIAGGVQGSAASGSYSASGGVSPYTFAVTSGTFPSTGGLSSAGAALGNWKTAGSYSWQVTATDSVGTTTILNDSCTNTFATLTLTGTLPNCYDSGDSYSQSLTIAGGSGTYSNPQVHSGSLPTGLSLSVVSSTVVLSGTATAYGAFTFTVSVDSSDAQTAISASQTVSVGDLHWTATTGLWHFDQANNATTFTDSTGRHNSFPNQVNATGTGKATTSSPLVGSASYTDAGGSQDGAQCGQVSSDFDFGSAEYTVEATVNSSVSLPNGQFHGILNVDDTSSTRGWLWLVDGSTGKLTYAFSTSGGQTVLQASSALTSGTHQLAVCRDNTAGKTYMYMDGVKIAEASTSGTLNSNSYFLTFFGLQNIGAVNANTVWRGKGDEFRITKGICRYPSGTTYTPSARAFQNGGV